MTGPVISEATIVYPEGQDYVLEGQNVLLTAKVADADNVQVEASANGLSVVSLLTINRTIKPPSSIVSDGTVEVSDSVNAWLASSEVPAGSTLDLRGLTWWTDKCVKAVDKQFKILGDGFTSLRKTLGPRPRPATFVNPHFWLHPESEFYDFSVIGTNNVPDQKAGYGAYLADYEFEAAVRVDNPKGYPIRPRYVDAVWGDGVQFGGRNAGEVNVGGMFGSRSIIDRVGRQGLSLYGYGEAHDLDVLHGRRSGIDLEPDPANPIVGNFKIRRMSLTTIGNPIASAGSGDVNDILLEDITEFGNSMPVITARDSSGTGKRERWTIRRWNGSPSNTTPGTPALRIYRGKDWLIEDSKGFGATGVGGAVKGIEFVDCDGINIVRRSDFRPKGTIVVTNPKPDFVLVLGDGVTDDNIYS